MKLRSKVFSSNRTWESLCAEVCDWVNENLDPKSLVSISASETGRSILDTNGTIVVWFWEAEA